MRMRPRQRWSRLGLGWLTLVSAVVLTALLASVALAQSPGLDPPDAPQRLQVIELSHDLVSLNWNDSQDATISGYQILRRLRDHSPVGVFEVLVEDTGSAATEYVDRQVQPETRYNYRVKARNAAGLSPRSNFVRADTPAAPPLAEPEPPATQEPLALQEPTPQPAPQPAVGPVLVWTAELTVEVVTEAYPPWSGYSDSSRGNLGALSADSFWLEQREYTVLALFAHGGGLTMASGRPLPHDFSLLVGARRYESSHSLVPVFNAQGRYWWPDDAIDWADGDQLTVSILLDPDTTALDRAPAPPAAYLTDVPAAHNGVDPFSLKLIFDTPDLPLTAGLLRDQALQVFGASLLAVERGRNAHTWIITLQPSGAGLLIVGLRSPGDCADPGAICTADGRMLRGRVSAMIDGPPPPPRLAALQLDGATLSPTFDAEVELYSAEAEAGLEQLTVEAAAAKAATSLTITPADADPLAPGHQVVLADTGETTIALSLEPAAPARARVYLIVVRRAASASDPPSSELNALRFSGLPELEFSEQESHYELDAPKNLEQTTVVVNRAESEAGVDVFTVRGDELIADAADHDPNAPGHQSRLSEWGDTLVLVRVSSSDGRTQRGYVTHLRGQPAPSAPGLRSSPAANLRNSLRSSTRNGAAPALSALSVSDATLDPAFSSAQFNYTASVAADVSQVTISASPDPSDATLLLIPADADAVLAGHQLDLGPAGTETMIVVIVRNTAGQLNSYLVGVQRAAPTTPTTPTTLQSLVVEDHDLNPGFSAEWFFYSVAAEAETTELTLNADATASAATITFVPPDHDAAEPGYQVALGATGSQTVTQIAMIIQAPGSATQGTYLVSITRAAPDPTDAALRSLSIDDYELTPAFDSDEASYGLTVPGNVASVTLNAVSNSLSAIIEVSPADADALTPGYQIPLTAVESGAQSTSTTATVTVTSADGSTTQTYTVDITRLAASAGGFKFIEVGWHFACAIRMDGTPACWNYDVPREIDLSGPINAAPDPEEAPTVGVIIELTAAIDSACALRPDGRVFCWGETDHSWGSVLPIGTDTMTDRSDAGRLIDMFTWYNSIRLLADGSVDSPAYSFFTIPLRLKAGPYQAVAAASEVGCALDLDDHIKCWNRDTEIRLSTDAEYKRIDAGGRTVCGIKADDSALHCWKLVDGGVRLGTEPEGAFRSVDIGYHHTICALRLEGTVECWWPYGPNSRSGLDTRAAPDQAESRMVRATRWSDSEWLETYDRNVANLNEAPDEDTLGYTMIAMDRTSFACGLRTDHTIACWGWDNEYLASKLPPFESPWHNSASLIALNVDTGAFTQVFDREITEYELSVDNATTAITITPEVTNLFATYVVSADTDTTVVDDTIDLSVGANVVTITVTASDTVTTKVYTVTITRADAD